MVGRVADDDVELHVEDLFGVDAVDEGVGVGLSAVLEDILGGSATRTLAIFPFMLGGREENVALGGVEGGDGILAVGGLGAVDRTTGDKGGQPRDGEAKELIMEDVVEALLQVGEDRLQAHDETLGDFAQEDAALTAGVQKGCLGVAKEFLRQ